MPPLISYTPFIPDRVDHDALITAAATFFGLAPTEVGVMFEAYRAFHEAKDYARSLGERKTLCFEEAFLLYLAMVQYRPQAVVEIGTQYGKSARRLIDMAGLIGLGARVTCFDVANAVRHFEPGEAELVVEDVTGQFVERVLRVYDPDLLFLDVHPYGLLKEAVTATLAGARACVLAVHDCSHGLYNPLMTLGQTDPNVTSLTGLWERYVLAEAFGIVDPGDARLDDVASPTHRLRVFDTPHGLAIIVPLTLAPATAVLPVPDR